MKSVSHLSSFLEGLSSALGYYTDPEDPRSFEFHQDASPSDVGLLLAASCDLASASTSAAVDSRLRFLAGVRRSVLSKRTLPQEEVLELMSCPVQQGSLFAKESLAKITSSTRKRAVEQTNQNLLERALKRPRLSAPRRTPSFPRGRAFPSAGSRPSGSRPRSPPRFPFKSAKSATSSVQPSSRPSLARRPSRGRGKPSFFR